MDNLVRLPFAIWVGPETSALQKNAALEFQRFLLSEPQQRKALSFGLRPADPSLAVDDTDDSLFVRWQSLGVRNEIQGTDVMQPRIETFCLYSGAGRT